MAGYAPLYLSLGMVLCAGQVGTATRSGEEGFCGGRSPPHLLHKQISGTSAGSLDGVCGEFSLPPDEGEIDDCRWCRCSVHLD